MSIEQAQPTSQAGPATPSIEAQLGRILDAVENNRRRGKLELMIAIVLSLAALCSTWSGYQANKWGSEQGSSQAAADTAERKAAEDTIVGLQLRTFDGITMIEYWRALRQNDAETRDAMFARMRPQLRQAIEAAIAAGVLHDPKVAGPLQRPEYVLAEEQDAKTLREEAHRLHAAARVAGQNSGSYVMLTLMFALVLFFGGITGTFTARLVRMGLGCMALILFFTTIVILARLPVFHQG